MHGTVRRSKVRNEKERERIVQKVNKKVETGKKDIWRREKEKIQKKEEMK